MLTSDALHYLTPYGVLDSTDCRGVPHTGRSCFWPALGQHAGMPLYMCWPRYKRWSDTDVHRPR